MTEQEATDILKAAGAEEVHFRTEFDYLTGVGAVAGEHRNAVAGRADGDFNLRSATAILRAWVEKHVAGKPLGPEAFGSNNARSR